MKFEFSPFIKTVSTDIYAYNKAPKQQKFRESRRAKTYFLRTYYENNKKVKKKLNLEIFLNL